MISASVKGDVRLRQCTWLVAAALCWRWLLAVRTPVPAEDGANYLWMAERIADGDAAAALGEVFQPAWPLLIAVPVSLGFEAFAAAQFLGCLCGALALVPAAAIATRLSPRAGVWAALLLAFLPLPARQGGEVLTEPLFLLVSSVAMWEGVRGRYAWLGLWTGVAFWVRPEAPVLALGFLVGVGWRAWRLLPPLVLLVLALGFWRQLCGLGFDPLPKLAFHEARDDLPERGAFFANLLEVPWQFVEAFGPAGVLVLLGFRRPLGAEARSLIATFGIGVAAICTFVVRRRFFTSWTGALLPLCCRGLGVMSKGLRVALLAALTAFGMFAGWRGVTAENRIAERLVGEYLFEILPPDRDVAGDMTRVIYFAGRRPLPPRHFSVEQLVKRARQPGVGAVVLRARHSDTDTVARALSADFADLVLPRELRAPAKARGIIVLIRR